MATTSLNKAALALVRALKEAHTTPVDVVPPGWMNSHDLRRLTGLKEGRLKEKLRAISTESKRFRIMRDGRVISVPHYRLR